jgi:dGTPase
LVGPVRALKDFLFERMYRHHRLMRMQAKAERVVVEMFEAYMGEPRMLPEKVRDLLAASMAQRVIADYIAGMTDRYAMEEWEKLFDPYRRA